MKKTKLTIFVLLVFLLSCGPPSQTTLPTSIVSPQATKPVSTNTPIPPTITPTPSLIVINSENFENLSIIDSLEIDQSEYVSSTYSDFQKISYKEGVIEAPTGDVLDAYFTSHFILENGEILGLLIEEPAKCSIDANGQGCFIETTSIKIINITKNEVIWSHEIELFSGMDNFAVDISLNKHQITIPSPKDIFVRDIIKGENLFIIPTSDLEYNPYLAAISPDGNKLIFVLLGRNLSTVFIYDTVNYSPIFKYNVNNLVSDIEWANDSNLIAIGKSDGSIDIVNLSKEKVETVIKGNNSISEIYTMVTQIEGEKVSYYFMSENTGIYRLKFSNDGKKIGFIEKYFPISPPDGFTQEEADKYQEVNKLYLLNLVTKQIENEITASFQGNGEIIWEPSGDFFITLSDEPNPQFLPPNTNVLSMDYIIYMDSRTIKKFKLPEIYTEEETSRFPLLSSSSLFINEDITQITVIRSGFSRALLSILEVKR